MTDPRQPAPMRAAALITILIAAACVREPPETPATPQPETVPLHILARNIDSYRGRTVRTCGEWNGAMREADGTLLARQLNRIDPTSPHGWGAVVFVAPCSGARPPLSDGCINGRIAREDGSLNDPERIEVVSHRIGSSEWWLHPQCRAPGR